MMVLQNIVTIYTIRNRLFTISPVDTVKALCIVCRIRLSEYEKEVYWNENYMSLGILTVRFKEMLGHWELSEDPSTIARSIIHTQKEVLSFTDKWLHELVDTYNGIEFEWIYNEFYKYNFKIKTVHIHQSVLF